MLVLEARPVEVLWDELLPIETRLLPADLVVIDRVLDDPAVLAPVAAVWQREAERRGRSSAGHGRPTIPMASYVRLMVVKQRNGWGYERLAREVSDSLHLRRFVGSRWVSGWRMRARSASSRGGSGLRWWPR